MAFTTVDLPWATCPIVPKSQALCDTPRTDVDCGLSADDLVAQRSEGGNVQGLQILFGKLAFSFLIPVSSVRAKLSNSFLGHFTERNCTDLQ